jgi:DNA invertase Pin-like site-specific DNA recombinase
MKAGLYMRVSKDDMHCENQRLILEEWVKSNKPEVAIYFQDELSSRKTRPEKERLMREFRNRKIDTIVCVRLDRFARSLQELISNVNEIVNSGGRWVCTQNGFDFDAKHWNASQQLIFHIFASFAEFERGLISERTLEGLARARAEGKRLGRPKKKRGVEKIPPFSDSKPLPKQKTDVFQPSISNKVLES